MKKKLLPLLLVLALAAGAYIYAEELVAVYREVTFYWTERTETELKVKAYAEEKGIFYSEYPQSLIELLERNPETEEFVLNYPFR